MKLKYFILLLFGILVSCSEENMDKDVYGDKIAPPKCINNICLYQHIDEIKEKISGYVDKNIWSPIQALESADYKVMEATNWVQLTSCESPGTVKIIL